MTPQDDLNFPLEGHDVDAYLAHGEEETKQILSRQVKLYSACMYSRDLI